MKRQLSKRELELLSAELKGKFAREFFSRKDRAELQDDSLLFRNGELLFFRLNNQWIPSLKYLQFDGFLPTVVIDMGAVAFVASGADVMRPGIVQIDDVILANSLVAVVDEKNHKPVVVGQALFDASAMRSLFKGKVIKTLHYVGDKWWGL